MLRRINASVLVLLTMPGPSADAAALESLLRISLATYRCYCRECFLLLEECCRCRSESISFLARSPSWLNVGNGIFLACRSQSCFVELAVAGGGVVHVRVVCMCCAGRGCRCRAGVVCTIAEVCVSVHAVCLV